MKRRVLVAMLLASVLVLLAFPIAFLFRGTGGPAPVEQGGGEPVLVPGPRESWPPAVAGVVVDAAGNPISGAIVSVLKDRNEFRPESRKPVGYSSVVSRENGGFELTDLHEGPLIVQVTAQGFVGRLVDMDLDFQTQPHDLKVVLDQGAEVTGSFTDAQGSAMKGLSVYLIGMGTESVWSQRVATNSEGRFHFEGFPAGRYRVLAQAPARSRSNNPNQVITLQAGQHKEVRLVFD